MTLVGFQLTKLAITYDNIDSWPLEFFEVTDSKRKNKVKSVVRSGVFSEFSPFVSIRFLLAQPLESIADTVDLYPEGCA